MKLFLVQVTLLTVVAVIIAAVFFRSRRANVILKNLRTIGWAYVIVIVLVAAIRLWQDGGN